MSAFLTDYDTHAVPTMLKPTLDVPAVDPVFGSTIVRITDPALSPGSSGLVHEYSRFPEPNLTNELMVVGVLGGPERGEWQVRNLADQTLRARIETSGDGEFSWSGTDKNLLFYRFGNQLRIFHADTNQTEVLMEFPLYTTIGTRGEGRPSDDWRWYAGIAVRPTGQRDLLVVDLQAREVMAAQLNVGDAVDWVSMSPSGRYVVVMRTDGAGTQIFDRYLTMQRQLFSDFAHSDFAFGIDGQEYLVYIAVTGKQLGELGCPNPPNGSPIAAVRLSDGKKTILLGDCNDENWKPIITGAFLPWGGDYHFSGIISRSRPGWVLVSTFAAPDVPQDAFSREVFLVNLDGSGAVERLAHHHSVVGTLPDGSRDYWAEPHCTSSWDGLLVFFASNWGEVGKYYLFRLQMEGAEPPLPPPPPQPIDVNFDTGMLTWTWNQGSGTAATAFHVRCGTQSGIYTILKVIKDPTRRSILLKNVTGGPGKFFCVVAAANAGGESAFSKELFLNATTSTPPPQPPTDVGVTG